MTTRKRLEKMCFVGAFLWLSRLSTRRPASALTTTITDRIHTTKRDWIQDTTYSFLSLGFFRSKVQNTDSSSRIFRCIKMTVRRKVSLELCQ